MIITCKLIVEISHIIDIVIYIYLDTKKYKMKMCISMNLLVKAIQTAYRNEVIIG